MVLFCFAVVESGYVVTALYGENLMRMLIVQCIFSLNLNLDEKFVRTFFVPIHGIKVVV